MEIIEAKEYERMQFNVYPIHEDILDHFPQLGDINSFSKYESDDKDQVIRYVLLMYDKDSPVHRVWRDIEQRKREVATIAGFDPESDRALEMYDLSEFDITDPEYEYDDETGEQVEVEPSKEIPKTPSVVDLVIDFLKFQKHRLWAMIVSNEQVFYEYQKALIGQVVDIKTDKDKLQAINVKSKIMEDSEIINDRLDKYYDQLSGDKRVSEIVKRRISPEMMASSN